MGPDDDRAPGRTRSPRAPWPLTSALSEPVSSVTPMPSSRAGARPSRGAGGPAGRSGPGARPGARPGGRRERVGGDGGLARPDVALEQAQHRRRARQVVADRVHRRDLVGGQRRPPARAAGSARRRARSGSPHRRSRRRRASAAPRSRTALPPPLDHAELERQELVEGEPAQRRVARLERRPGSGPPRWPGRSATRSSLAR